MTFWARMVLKARLHFVFLF